MAPRSRRAIRRRSARLAMSPSRSASSPARLRLSEHHQYCDRIHWGGTSSDTKNLPAHPDATAPDRSDVRLLLHLRAGGPAPFEMAPGQTSVAVVHRTVEGIWF